MPFCGFGTRSSWASSGVCGHSTERPSWSVFFAISIFPWGRPGWTQSRLPSTSGSTSGVISGFGLDHEDPVVAGLAAPEFARPAVELAHIGVGLVAGEHIELLGCGIEAHDRLGREIGEPDLVLVVDKDRIGAGLLARQLPAPPGAVGGIVHRDMAGVPLADP